MEEIYEQIMILSEDSDGYKAVKKLAKNKGEASEILAIIRTRRVWCECVGSDYNQTDTMNEDDPAAHAMWCPVWIEAALVAEMNGDPRP
jgi:hypothetical protein